MLLMHCVGGLLALPFDPLTLSRRASEGAEELDAVRMMIPRNTTYHSTEENCPLYHLSHHTQLHRSSNADPSVRHPLRLVYFCSLNRPTRRIEVQSTKGKGALGHDAWMDSKLVNSLMTEDTSGSRHTDRSRGWYCALWSELLLGRCCHGHRVRKPSPLVGCREVE